MTSGIPRVASDQGSAGVALGMGALGIVLLWSAAQGRNITYTLQQLVQGKKPVPGPMVNYFPLAGGAGIGSANAPVTNSAIASDAMRYVGAGWKWAGAPALGVGNWDCSSFCNWVIGHDLGLAIPGFPAGKYTGQSHGPATVQWLTWPGCVTIGHDGKNAQAGDLAVWQSHMGICTGPNEMISAENAQAGTQVSAINGFMVGEVLFIRRLR